MQKTGRKPRIHQSNTIHYPIKYTGADLILQEIDSRIIQYVKKFLKEFEKSKFK